MKKRVLIFILFVTIIIVQSCVKDDISGGEEQDNKPDEISYLFSLKTLGKLPIQLYESSGIAVSGSNEIWSHEDSGNENVIYCIDTTGAINRTLTIANSTNIDWEDMATDSDGKIYLCDAGNNDNSRKNLAVYVVQAPDSFTGNIAGSQKINFEFEDQKNFPPPASNLNFDVEAMIWYNAKLYLFTKNRSSPQNGWCKMYSLPAVPGSHKALLLDSIYLGNTNEKARVTSADINKKTGELVLLTTDRLILFKNYPGEYFFKGEKTEYPFDITFIQNEAIAFVSDYVLYMSEEGASARAGNLYKITLPHKALK